MTYLDMRPSPSGTAYGSPIERQLPVSGRVQRQRPDDHHHSEGDDDEGGPMFRHAVQRTMDGFSGQITPRAPARPTIARRPRRPTVDQRASATVDADTQDCSSY